MLDLIYRYENGFVAVPILLAGKQGKVFDVLAQAPGLSLDELSARLHANPGHLQVALKMWQALNWVLQDEGYSLTAEAHCLHLVPNDIQDVYRIAPDRFLAEFDPAGKLSPWVEQCRQRWGGLPPPLADYLDGVLVVPLVLALERNGLRNALEADYVAAPVWSRAAHQAIRQLFVALGWGQFNAEGFQLSDTGRFMLERALFHGVPVSYIPLLRQAGDLLFGNCAGVFARDAAGRETHVDRALNVIASGFQHRKYFCEVEEMVVAIFTTLPLEKQPRYLADMGCGDGTLLRTLYRAIAARTPRGQALERFPLLMIGVDFNQAALDETSRTLEGIPHLVLRGDIGDPAKLIADLRGLGIADPENILHIRSFLDHDRSFRPPEDSAALATRSRLPLEGVYVDRAGQALAPAAVAQSLVEHLARWSDAVAGHGLIVAEVHCLTRETTRRHAELTNSLHFEALQAFSLQQPVEADVFLSAAAEAGLLPRAGFLRRYPRTFPFTHITLGWLRKVPFRIRHAQLSDLPGLLDLEARSCPESARASAEELSRRLDVCSEGNFVLEIDGRISGAIFSQRIAGVELLEHTRATEVGNLHTPHGPVVQLLGLNVLPEMQHLGLGEQLLQFMLMCGSLRSGVSHVAGVTRCRNYPRFAHLDMAGYAALRDEHGQPIDPVLQFHCRHGARIRSVVPDYRPEDTDNRGHGVLIEYDLQALESATVAVEEDAGSEAQLPQLVAETVRMVLGPKKSAYVAVDRPFMEIGLDSLQHLELRTILGRRLGLELEPTVFFNYPTPARLAEYLERRLHGAVDEPKAAAVAAPILPTEPVDIPSPRIETAGRYAIVGMACRLPGDVHSPDDFWKLLAAGRDAITEVPAERRELVRSLPNEAALRRGGFLHDVDRFDAPFFRIGAVEARAMDPQQRILLEVAWESLENAAIDPARLAGTSSGIFVGLFARDYELLLVKQRAPLGAYFSTGNSAAVAAGRLAYFLGCQGPALTVDTACSSSLVALHLACQSLRDGESDLALALGVNLMLSHELGSAFCNAGMLSPDGQCRTFDASANGYVRGEGCVAVVLKRLENALADGDRIWAVIRGSAVNQDGASNGLTAPTGAAQEAVLRKALSVAGVRPEEVSLVECHGTGTPLGDPIEFDALRTVYGQGRGEVPLVLGSVKTNVGHTEAAGGLTGLMKVVLALQHRSIPANLHFHQANPHIALDSIPAVVPVRSLAWNVPPGRRRLAGVSSFGFSGTNAHVIVEEAPEPKPHTSAIPERALHVLALSARNDVTLRESAGRYIRWLQEYPEANLADVAFSTNTGRTHFEHRAACISSSNVDLRSQLDDIVDGTKKATHAPNRPRVAFLFTGQSSQYAGMARTLYERQPVFRQVLDHCGELLRERLPRSLLEAIFHDPSALQQTLYTQPALYALEMSLVELWRSWGISPDVVLGHSVGEYAAACTAGAFSLDDGLRLIAERARLMQELPAGGAMAAISAARDRVLPLLRDLPNVSLAADNGAQTVVSGTASAVEALLLRAKTAGFIAQRLSVSHAFHSELLAPMLDAFEHSAKTVLYQPTQRVLIGNVTGQALLPGTLLDSAYWRRHARAPVEFGRGVQSLAEQDCDIVLEIGPTPVLTTLASRCWPDSMPAPAWIASLRRGRGDEEQLSEAVAKLYERGCKIDWTAWDRPWPRRKLTLPTYPFQRQRYWIEEAPPESALPESAESAPALLVRLEQAPVEQRTAVLSAYVKEAVAQALDRDGQPLDEQAGFFDLGMDSLMAVTLRDRLQTDLGAAHAVSATIFIDHPSIARLTRHLAECLLNRSAPPTSAVRQPVAEPIAIVGLACRFPGTADPDAFWKLLCDGVDPIREVPAERWDIDAYYDPALDAPGKMCTRHGGFLDEIDRFDPHFFGIAPREAESIDPQHRLLLEVSWEALENAGIAPQRLLGSQTGVFVGICSNDYTLLSTAGGAENMGQYFGIGCAMSAAAGRVAYTLGLQGPALAIDTACSSSLVAVHQACQSLHDNACDLALAGGVNLILNPLLNVALSRARMLAPDGRCKTFDAAADGYVRGDGCGVVVLRRLADAQRDGDRILAVIRGSAINQDGRSGGLTVPNGPAQEAVIHAALARAGVAPQDVAYVEAHGTGTALGDPIEVQAIAAVLGQDRQADRPVLLGSVKSNIGHLEAAAGVAGLIKVVVALQHDAIPAQLHFHSANPHIPWDRLPVRVVEQPSPWPIGPRIAGVSSFGFIGTNVHVVVEEAPALSPVEAGLETGPEHLLCLSAKSVPALRELARRYADWLGRHPDVELGDFCATLNLGRSHFEQRDAFVVTSNNEARRRLIELADGVNTNRVCREAALKGSAFEVAAQYVHGENPDLAAWTSSRPGRRLSLPTYPFQRQRYWVETAAFQPRPIVSRKTKSLLGDPLRLPSGQVVYQTEIGVTQQPYLSDHRVFERITVPGAWYAVAALAAFEAPGRVRDLVIPEPLFLGERETRRVLLTLSPGQESQRTFELHSTAPNEPERWLLHARGILEPIEAGRDQSVAGELPRRESMQPSSTDELYEAFARSGLHFGPAFRGIRSLWTSPNEAIGELALPEGLETPADAVIHPVLLDACLQLTGAALGDVGRAPLVPLGIERLEIEAAGVVFCHVRLRPRKDLGALTLTADLCLMGADNRRLGLIVGLTCKRVESLGDQRPKVDDWLYQRVWHAHQKDVADFFVDPASLRARLDHSPTDTPKFSYTELIRHMEELAVQYIVQALTRFGWRMQPGERIDNPHAGVAPQQYRLVDRLLGILEKNEILHRYKHGWIVSRLSGHEAPATVHTRLVEQYPQGIIELTLLARCGEQLEAVLRGASEPLPLLFPKDGSLSVEDLYREAPTVQRLNRLAGQVLEAALERRPSGRRLRVLEIGAGTGGTTAHLLPILPAAHTDYLFTDISAAFIPAAEQRFHDHSHVSFQVLDIERDPASQGFAGKSFDIVIAANVLHATANVLASLRNVRQLLAPGGLLILLEAVTPRAWLDLTFGLLPGWWKFQDSLRSDYPLLTAAQWQSALDTIECPGSEVLFADEENTDQALILARASTHTSQLPTKAGGTWLVLVDAGQLGKLLADRLTLRGARCILVERGTSYQRLAGDHYRLPGEDAANLGRLLSEISAAAQSLRGVIYLWGLDRAEPGSAASMQADLRNATAPALHLVQALLRHQVNARLWLVTRGVHSFPADMSLPIEETLQTSLAQAPLWGLACVLAREHPELNCHCVDLDPVSGGDEIDLLLAELLTPDEEGQVAHRNGQRRVARLLPNIEAERAEGRLVAPPGLVQLQVAQRGTLESLRLAGLDCPAPGPDCVQIAVHASGLNFRDVLNALGLLPTDPNELGNECVGTVRAVGAGVTGLSVGDEVLGFARNCFASIVNTSATLVVPKPAGMRSEAAATLPVAFTTAWYSLCEVAALRRGERVLIHAAAGGVGQAAVQIAQLLGAEVYATASPEKWDALRRLGVQHLSNSRSLDFETAVREQTAGRGVDVVLNSLSGEFIERSVTLLAPGGRFVEMGKRGIWSAEQFAALRPDASYRIVDLLRMLATEPKKVRQVLAEVLEQVKQQRLRPLDYVRYDLAEAETAFRRMQQGRHVGKIVLRVPPSASRLNVQATYLITGGLGGLGLATARWLVERGARHLVLVGRRPATPETNAILQGWCGAGCNVEVLQTDVAQEAEVSRILQIIAAALPPLRGIFHAAGVLDDGALLNQTWDRFENVLGPKALGAWHLHRQTMTLPLDLFVLYSSTASVLGSTGQSNHAAANMFLDMLAHARQRQGLPATAINWSGWSEIGAAARPEVARRLAEQGIGMIPPAQGIAALERILDLGLTQAAVSPARVESFRLASQGKSAPAPATASKNETASRSRAALRSTLHEARPEDRVPLLIDHLRCEVAQVLRLSSEHWPNPRQGFFELGMDSLLALEMRHRLQSTLRLEQPLSTTALFDHPTIEELARHLADLLPGAHPVGNGPHSEANDPDLELVSEVAALSERELEGLISREWQTLIADEQRLPEGQAK